MIEHDDLDRAIDTAARQLIGHAPSRGLTDAVMTRVREDARPSSHRLMWAAVPASVLLCMALAVTMLSRPPQSLPEVAAARPLVIGQPLAVVEPPDFAAPDVTASGRSRSAFASRMMASNAQALPHDVSPIAPIDAQPIAIAAIEVPQLELPAPATIEALTVEHLTIEPLPASN